MANSSSRSQNSRTSTSTTLGGTGANAPPLGDALSAALDEFRKSVPDKDLAHFKTITYDVLCREIIEIQKKQDSRREMMHLSRIQSCLEAMKQFGQIIEIFVNVANEVAFIWGPMKLLLLTACTFADSFETLLQAYQRIGEQMPLLKQYQSLFASSPQLHEALKLMFVDILEFHRLALRFFSGNRRPPLKTDAARSMIDDYRTEWMRFFKSMWKNFETKFGGVLERLGRHKDHVESCASLASFQKTQDSIDELRTENHNLYQKYQTDMGNFQTHNTAEMQTIQTSISSKHSESLDEFLKLHTELQADQAHVQLQWQKHHDDQASQSRELANRHKRYIADIAEMDKTLARVLAGEQAKKLQTVRQWLAVGHQVHEDHADFQKLRTEHPSTAKWILKHEAIVDWINSDSPASPNLWINGIPGAGKTILASAIIDECAQMLSSSTCFFYCHDEDPLSCTAVGVIKALVDQLLVRHQHLLPPSYTRRTGSGEPVLRSLALATKLLEDYCLTLSKTFIVIDGLDECILPERKQILDTLLAIVSECDLIQAGKVRLLIVSQVYPDIRRAYFGSSSSRLTPKIIPISDKDNSKDIGVFVGAWVDRIARKYDLPTDVTDHLTNLTMVNAKGMFLFAKLVMHNLYQLPNREALLDAILKTNFPTELKAAYKRILDRIKSMSSNEEWTEATKLLGWMVCAKRRLTWKEMQVALSIDVECQAIEYENKHLRKHIHEICGSLVSVQGDRVSLVHSTAKEFITQVMPDIHKPSIECDLTVLCLEYLTFPCFEKFERDDEPRLQQLALQGYLAFQDYAIATWFHHVNAFVNSGQDFLTSGSKQESRLDAIGSALDHFMDKYSEIDWEKGLVERCNDSCRAFEKYFFYENLVLLTSHIYTFQERGFEARHKISIDSLDEALTQNRKVLEELPTKLGNLKAADDLIRYGRFYDPERLYKCNRITCRYFSEGLKDKKTRKDHINVHDRPYHCDVKDCLGAEGFAKDSDLQKHMRAFHPELCDLAETFNKAIAKGAKANHACTICDCAPLFKTKSLYPGSTAVRRSLLTFSPPKIPMPSPGPGKRRPSLWKQAYEALNDDEKSRERLHKLNKMLKQELGKPSIKLRSDDGYRELLGMIRKKARKLESKQSTEKIGAICSNMMKIEDIVAAGANVGGPYIAIPAAALFSAFAMNEMYTAERAAMFEVAETVADYVVMNKKAQDWTTVQANDDDDMRELKESLQSVFVSLYKAIIFASAQLMLSLNGDFQWIKNVAKHYDWAGQLETLNKRQHRISQFMHSKEWQEAINPPKNRVPSQRDLKTLMGPGPRNPLHWAAALGVPEQVAFYVQKNEYPVNALTKQSWTAAHLAAREGHTKILKTLMTVPGIDLSIKNREERTPLHIAAIFNRKWAAKVLLERSPKLLGSRDKWQRTAFTIAAEKGYLDILKVLKQFGQDMNETTVNQGWTALHLAAENGHVETVKWLAANGTKKGTKVRDGPQKGLTAKQIAELNGKAQVLDFL